MEEPGARSPGDAEKGLSRRGGETDTSSLSAGVDPEKRSGEHARPASMGTSDLDPPGEDQLPPSRQQTAEDDTGDGNGVVSRTLTRVLSRVSTKSSWNPGPPPDGGL